MTDKPKREPLAKIKDLGPGYGINLAKPFHLVESSYWGGSDKAKEAVQKRVDEINAWADEIEKRAEEEKEKAIVEATQSVIEHWRKLSEKSVKDALEKAAKTLHFAPEPGEEQYVYRKRKIEEIRSLIPSPTPESPKDGG